MDELRDRNPDDAIFIEIRLHGARALLLGTQDMGWGSANEGGSWYVMAGGVSLLSGLPVALR
jgi:hypothetical protein